MNHGESSGPEALRASAARAAWRCRAGRGRSARRRGRGCAACRACRRPAPSARRSRRCARTPAGEARASGVCGERPQRCAPAGGVAGVHWRPPTARAAAAAPARRARRVSGAGRAGGRAGRIAEEGVEQAGAGAGLRHHLAPPGGRRGAWGGGASGGGRKGKEGGGGGGGRGSGAESAPSRRLAPPGCARLAGKGRTRASHLSQTGEGAALALGGSCRPLGCPPPPDGGTAGDSGTAAGSARLWRAVDLALLGRRREGRLSSEATPPPRGSSEATPGSGRRGAARASAASTP